MYSVAWCFLLLGVGVGWKAVSLCNLPASHPSSRAVVKNGISNHTHTHTFFLVLAPLGYQESWWFGKQYNLISSTTAVTG